MHIIYPLFLKNNMNSLREIYNLEEINPILCELFTTIPMSKKSFAPLTMVWLSSSSTWEGGSANTKIFLWETVSTAWLLCSMAIKNSILKKEGFIYLKIKSLLTIKEKWECGWTLTWAKISQRNLIQNGTNGKEVSMRWWKILLG